MVLFFEIYFIKSMKPYELFLFLVNHLQKLNGELVKYMEKFKTQIMNITAKFLKLSIELEKDV